MTGAHLGSAVRVLEDEAPLLCDLDGPCEHLSPGRLLLGVVLTHTKRAHAQQGTGNSGQQCPPPPNPQHTPPTFSISGGTNTGAHGLHTKDPLLPSTLPDTHRMTPPTACSCTKLLPHTKVMGAEAGSSPWAGVSPPLAPPRLRAGDVTASSCRSALSRGSQPCAQGGGGKRERQGQGAQLSVSDGPAGRVVPQWRGFRGPCPIHSSM